MSAIHTTAATASAATTPAAAATLAPATIQRRLQEIEKEWSARKMFWSAFVQTHRTEALISRGWSWAPELSQDLKSSLQEIQSSMDPSIVPEATKLLQEMEEAERTVEQPSWIAEFHREGRKDTPAWLGLSLPQKDGEEEQKGHFSRACRSRTKVVLDLLHHPSQLPSLMKRYPGWTLAVQAACQVGCRYLAGGSPYFFTRMMNTILLGEVVVYAARKTAGLAKWTWHWILS